MMKWIWSLPVCNIILLWNSDFKGMILGVFWSLCSHRHFLLMQNSTQTCSMFYSFFSLLSSKPTSLAPSSWERPGKWKICYSDNLIWDKVLMDDNTLLLTMPTGFPGGASGKGPACQFRRLRVTGSIPGSGRSPGRGHGNPLQYSCLGNPVDRGAWWATVHGVSDTWTSLKWLSTYTTVPTCPDRIMFLPKNLFNLKGTTEVSVKVASS